MTAVDVRRATEHDRPAVLQLMSAALGWQAGDLDEELFRWKHEQSPFGSSPAWVAEDAGIVVGFRTFMRWEFEEQGEPVPAVRAVDTATHPAHRGRGIFRSLTLAALEELQADGVQLVFNTPNDQSRPGYLKMGWEPVGVLPVGMRPRSPIGLWRTARARTPAELWSECPRAGAPVARVLDDPDLARCLRSHQRRAGMATRRTPEYLRWRYGMRDLQYRAFVLNDDLATGFALYRVRRRGGAHECALAELVAPDDSARVGAALVRGALRASGADYAVALRSFGRRLPATVPVPGQGPLLVARRLARGTPVPAAGSWRLTLGDVELF